MLAWVSMLVGQQLLSRCLTFLLNVGVTRAMPIDEYGVTVNLALLDATVLFVSREPLRRIAMRGTSPAHVRSCVNLSWFVSIPVSVVITMVASWFWTAPKYSTCMSLYSFALVIDMLSEPFYLVTLIESRVGRRVAFESFATILRVTATFALVVAPFAMGINAFGWAQLVYAITKLAAFVGDAIMWRSTLALPTFLDNGKAFDADVSGLGGMFAIQTVEKYLLTEGEKIVLVGIGNDLQAQGVYALVQNLGSLVARFLLQPIEEVAAIHFSKEGRSAAAFQEITFLTKFMVLLGLVFVVFGPAYSFVLLHILYGSLWSQGSNAASVLSLYCVYVLTLGVNGVTEAFMLSLISKQELQTYSILLVPFSGLYLLLSTALMPFGATGLILANSLSMSSRIAYSLWFIRKHFQTTWNDLLAAILPKFSTVSLMAVVPMILYASYSGFKVRSDPSLSGFACHIAVGIVCLISSAATVWKRERELVATGRSLFGKRARQHAE
ncbi:Protein RFT1 like protein [Plasmodiophora brassicae]